MDDIKAGIYGHKVIPLFHWMIFLVGDSAWADRLEVTVCGPTTEAATGPILPPKGQKPGKA
jgi:hypothetical protein